MEGEREERATDMKRREEEEGRERPAGFARHKPIMFLFLPSSDPKAALLSPDLAPAPGHGNGPPHTEEDEDRKGRRERRGLKEMRKRSITVLGLKT